MHAFSDDVKSIWFCVLLECVRGFNQEKDSKHCILDLYLEDLLCNTKPISSQMKTIVIVAR